jgi:hypothetical protein
VRRAKIENGENLFLPLHGYISGKSSGKEEVGGGRWGERKSGKRKAINIHNVP